MMSGGMLAHTLLSLFSAGVYVLLGVVLAVVGLAHVRKAHSTAALCLGGAGAILAFGTLAREVASLLLGVLGSTFVIVSQVLSMLTVASAGGLSIVGIYLLSQSLKGGR